MIINRNLRRKGSEEEVENGGLRRVVEERRLRVEEVEKRRIKRRS